ncbi:TPA: FtsW/RodA/SpoVE family cell cycle protein, partial [Streptococcus pneumoniae]
MKISKRHLLNYSILIPYLLLSILGLIVVYSTTSAILIEEGKSALQLVRNQGIFWIVSLILIALIYKLRLDFLRNERLIILVILIEMLLLFLARFIGISVNGAYGWISVAGVTIQPAEYLKIIIIWYLAHR